MPIVVNCECGRTLRAADGLSGRRAKCPGCGKVLTIPAASSAHALQTVALPADPFAAPPPIPPAPVAPGLPPRPRAKSEQPVSRPPPSPLHPLKPLPVASEEQDDFGSYDVKENDGDAAPARQPAVYIPPTRKFDSVEPPPTVRSMSATLPGDLGVRRHLYWVLLIVLLPLVGSTVRKTATDDHSIRARIRHTVTEHPEIAQKLKSLSKGAGDSEFFNLLPDHRIEGALLPHDTWMHWGFALASGAAFLAAVMLLFPLGHAKPQHLALVAVATGTAGILLLLAFQWLAFHMPLFRGRGAITLLLDLVWLIGQSYRLALTDHGFVLSFLGFTAGVGFCEEACKALPIILKARGSGFETWRSAMLWGLISGVGFGVSEGVTYSSDYYNGIAGPDMYLVRFVSCVGLHAIWAASVGIWVFRRQDFFRGELNVFEYILRTLQVVAVPMVLHGLYDTMLKQHLDGWALGVALISFGWLAFTIEKARKDFDAKPAAISPALA